MDLQEFPCIRCELQPAHELNGMCVSCARIDTKLVSGLDRPLTPFKVDLNGTPIDKGEDYGW